MPLYVENLTSLVDSFHAELISIRRDLHAHPELARTELRTTRIVADRLRAAGLEPRLLPGTGLICGKTVRAIVESVGIKDVLSKSLGSKNAANVAKATLKALLQLRRRENIYKARGLEARLTKKTS